MYAIDLFEADTQAGYVPVNPERPGSKHRKLGNLNLDAIKKSFEQPGAPKPATLQFLNGTNRTLTSAEVDAVADYYDSLKTKVEKANFIYRTFISQDKMANLLFKLKQLNLDLPPPREPDSGPEQLTLFQEKKSFDKPKYKDVNVQRAVRQAQADFPTAASDDEAFIKSMMVQQDQDQKNIDRLKTGLNRQKELLNKNSELDNTQDQTIDNLNKEIHNVEKDNDNLQLSLQQMQRANAELQQTLDRMRGKRTEPAPQLGVSVATDKQPTVPAEPVVPEPTATTVPANVATRQDLARVAQRVRGRTGGKTTTQFAQPSQTSIGTAQVGGQTAGVYQPLKQTDFPEKIKNRSFTDVPEKLKREDLTHGLEEGSVFGQQDFDTQMDLAKLKNKLTQPKPAQGAPVAEPQPVPARLSDLQSKQQKFANLADIKKAIETLQARATRGGRILPRGLAADLEDYFTTADVDRDYEEMLAKYQKQLGALQQYLGMRKVLWSPKKATHEMRAKELQETKESPAWEEGGREGYYHRPNKNPYKPGTQEHSDYNRGYEQFKGDKDWDVPKRPVREGNEWEMSDLDHLKELLAVLSIPVGIMTAAVYSRVKNALDKYNANQIMRALDKKDVVLSREDVQKLRSLLEIFDRAIERNDGGNAKRIAQDIRELAAKSKIAEDTKSEFKAVAVAKLKKALNNPKLDSDTRKDYETRLKKIQALEEGRAGYNPLTSEKHWHEVERYLASQINDRNLDPESRAEARQRYLEKRKEAQQKGWAK
jgi:hypothetical protein